MALTRYTLTGDLGDLIGEDNLVDDWSPRKPVQLRAWIQTNLPQGEPIVFTGLEGQVFLGPRILTVDPEDYTFSQDQLIGTDSTDLNWLGLQYQMVVEFPNKVTRSKDTWWGPWFELTENLDIKDVVEVAYAPPTATSLLMASILAALEAAAASAASAAASLELIEFISGLTGEDDAVAALLAGLSSDTRATLLGMLSGYGLIDDVEPRTTGLLLAAQELTLLTGGAALALSPTPRFVPHWPMTKAAGLSLVGHASIQPPGWATKVDKVRLHWFITATGTGVPKLRALVGSGLLDVTAADTAPGLPTAGDATPALPGSAYRRTITEFGPGAGTAWDITPNRLVNVQVGRDGTLAGDTATSTVGITGIEVLWA